MAWSGYPGPAGHGFAITKAERSGQCNNCYAQNFDPDNKTFRYKPDIYNVEFGAVRFSLCPDCLQKLDAEVVKWFGDNPIPDPDPDAPF